MDRWEHFEHESDIGVRGVGATLDRAFEEAALALTAVVTDPAKVRSEASFEVQCQAPELDLLLVDWLDAVIYEMATRGMVFGKYRVRIDGTRLDAVIEGEPVDRARHAPEVEPKAATFSELSVERAPDGAWVAQCVVDV